VPFHISTSLIGHVPYDGTFEEGVQAILNAANEWNTAGASEFQYFYAGLTEVAAVANDGVNAIIYSDTQCPYGDGCRAVEFSHPTTGTAHGFDIMLYRYGGDTGWGIYWSVKDIPHGWDSDLTTVTLHELGHALGLGHSFPGVVMGTDLGTGSARKHLYQDDIDGIQALYGPYTNEGFWASDTAPPLGSTVTLTLDYPLAANQDYEILLSLSGMDGTPLRTLDPDLLSGSPRLFPESSDSRILPIDSDFFPVADHPDIFQGFLGTLDAQGQATATISLPSDADLLGSNLYLSVVTYDDVAHWTLCDSPSCIEDVGVGVHLQVFDPAAIPTVSTWGMVAMTLLVLTAGTLVHARRRPAWA
ncbi:MAG: matrixin family metalloprotease, partial [Phycisphaerae bacterium]